MTEEFVLDITGTSVIKHITFNMIVTWESDETEEKCDDTFIEAEKIDPDKYNGMGPVIVLQEGIVEWMQKNLENTVYSRCTSLTGEFLPSEESKIGGPELLFGSEGDRSLFVLKWM